MFRLRSGLTPLLPGELHERRVSVAGVDVGMGTAKEDSEFTPAEEASAFQTNTIMCCCQIAISAAQLGVSAYLLADQPIRNTVNIIVCAVSIPLAIAGLVCLAHPEEAFAVPTMQVRASAPTWKSESSTLALAC